MRTKKNMSWTKIALFMSIVVFTGAIPSGPCQAETCGTPVSTRLIAGQHLDVGAITITNDANNAYVTYQTDGTWSISETHLDVATSPEQLKQTKKGNAIPGQFTFNTNHDPSVYDVTHTIDITTWPAGTQLYLAAHAVVTSAGSSETAWGEGVAFPGKNWAMYLGYEVQTCTEPPLNPGIIEFQDPNISQMENVTSLMVTLLRTEGSDGVVSVDIFSSDVSATFGEDYDTTPTTVVFEDGETMKQVEVFILNDQFDEADEQFLLRLTNVVGADLGPEDTATITIIDDDEPAQAALIFAQSEYIVYEYAGFVAVEIERVQGTDNIVFVDYNLSSVTADGGIDYFDTSGTLEFAIGETSKTISIQIIDDAIAEVSPEIFTVDLSNPVGATLQGASSVDVLIMDDDDMPE